MPLFPPKEHINSLSAACPPNAQGTSKPEPSLGPHRFPSKALSPI